MQSPYEIPDLTVIFAKIRKAKDASGLTNQEIADKSGIAYNTVCNITAGTAKQVSFHSVAAICVVLGLSLDETLGLRDTDTSSYIRELEIKNAKLTEQIKHYKRFAAISRTLVFALVGVCALLLCAVIGYVLFDMSLKTVGLFQSNGIALTAAFLAVIMLAAVILIFYALRTVVSDIKGERNEMPEM